jgi:uncharacterized protein
LNFRFAKSPIALRLPIFVGCLLLLWLPVAVPIYAFIPDRNWVSILSMAALYVEFIWLVRWWGRTVYQQPQILQDVGLIWNERTGRSLCVGLAIGWSSLQAMLLLESALGWLVWTPPTLAISRIVLEGLAIALGIGFAEELLFRGWLLDELQRDYRPVVATSVNAIAYALLHFIKPIEEIQRTFPSFPGLVFFGFILVWAKQKNHQNLGLPIGLHAGLVWSYYMVYVGQLAHYTGQVPVWVTGIDNNPLAGAIGLVALAAIAVWVKRKSTI